MSATTTRDSTTSTTTPTTEPAIGRTAETSRSRETASHPGPADQDTTSSASTARELRKQRRLARARQSALDRARRREAAEQALRERERDFQRALLSTGFLQR